MSFDPAIALWRFKNLLGLQLPKWEFIWECGGSFPHILLHSWEHEIWLPGSLLARTFVSPYFGRKFKVRVATEMVCLKILSSFETCLTTWPPCFVRHLLWTRTKYFWALSQISKGEVFSFLHLCSNFYTSCKPNLVEGWLFLGFNNAFAFTLYLECFHPSQDTHLPLRFLMVSTTSTWEDSLRNPQLRHTPSFGAHLFRSSSSFYSDNKHK
jgi:hypothetical protein